MWDIAGQYLTINLSSKLTLEMIRIKEGVGTQSFINCINHQYTGR